MCDTPSGGRGDSLRHARPMHPQAHRIVVNGSGDVVALTEAINQDAILGYYTNPWDPVVVHAAVVRAFNRHGPGDERPEGPRALTRHSAQG